MMIRLRGVATITLVMVLLVAACGDSDSTDGTAEATAAPNAAPATTQTPATTQAPATTQEPATTTARQVGSAKFEEIMAAGVVKVGTRSGTLMPYADVEGGTGFILELVTEVVSRLFGEIEIEFVGLAFDDRFPALADGTIDILATLTPRTAEREAIASPTDTGFVVDGSAIVVAPGSASTTADLAGGTIAVIRGSEEFERFYDNEDGRLYIVDDEGYMFVFDASDREDQIEALASGQVDGILLGLLGAIRQPSENGLDLVVAELGDPIPMWTADTEFAAELDAELAELVFDGTWSVAFERSFGILAPWAIEDLGYSDAFR